MARAQKEGLEAQGGNDGELQKMQAELAMERERLDICLLYTSRCV